MPLGTLNSEVKSKICTEFVLDSGYKDINYANSVIILTPVIFVNFVRFVIPAKIVNPVHFRKHGFGFMP